MFEIDRAVEDCASYEQIGPRRWRATITGLVTATAEADTPGRCRDRLTKAVDTLLADALRGGGPLSYDADGVTARIVIPADGLR